MPPTLPQEREKMTFAELGLSDEILKAVRDTGYTEPTPIQAKGIPPILMGRDVLATAQTGTGKTASFTLPLIDILAVGKGKARMSRALILEPTRELAAQVAENFDQYGKYHSLTKTLLIGGVSYVDQQKDLQKGVDVLIATPGRLLDHIERGSVMLQGIEILVIDEADRMMDMGFIPDIEKIVSLLPRKRQTLLFSATMPPEIRKLSSKFLDNPKEISVSPPATTAKTVIQGIVIVDKADKREALRKLLRNENVRNAYIFCNRKRDIAILHKSLTKHGFDAVQLHGDMDQTSRMETLERFKNGDVPLLVCSDVAARGLDVPAVSHVFNFDVPTSPEDYVHRIGRTGRAGMSGIAYTIATPEDARLVAGITRLIGQEIPLLALEGIDTLSFDEDSEGGRRRRPARKRSGAQTEKGEQSGKRKSRPRKESKDVQGEPAAEETPHKEDEEAALSASSGRGEKTRNARKRSRATSSRESGKRDSAKTDREPVRGLGDHVPAFFTRPLERKQKS